MKASTRIPLFELVSCISGVLDLLSPVVVDHHRKTAYVGTAIAGRAGVEGKALDAVFQAAMIHDIGAFSARERRDTLRFEYNKPHAHARVGGRLLEPFGPFEDVCRIVRFHHVPWEMGKGREFDGEPVPRASRVLHLADRVAVLLPPGPPSRAERDRITSTIREKTGALFDPDLVDVFTGLAAQDAFWLDAVSPALDEILRLRAELEPVLLDTDGLLQLARLLRRVIDFRSSFTAAHCGGVVEVAARLAALTGFSTGEQTMMRIAASLHDIGKLGVPLEVLEKPGRLTDDEFTTMRAHVYYTHRILERLPGLELVHDWAAFHQEKADGTGYPFGLKGPEMPLGARIMAVADVFTALTEDRPYRAGMPREKALETLAAMVSGHHLDPGVAGIMRRNFDELNTARQEAQDAAREDFRAFQASVAAAV